jgi:hypothetical protein
MSRTVSAAVRFEDHFGPVVPPVATSTEATSPSTTRVGDHAPRLHALVEQMRTSVAAATEARDIVAKVAMWESYRSARAEAIALVASTSDSPSARRLHSI